MVPLRLAFAGTPEFAAGHLRALLDSPHELLAVLTQPDRGVGRGKRMQASPVKTLASAAGIPVLQPPTLRADDIQEALRALDLDALIVVAYGLILPRAVLDLPRYGCINVHGSLLPRWRGAAPIQRAIEAGDEQSGITIMQMDEGLDTGPMLALEAVDIPPLASSGDLYRILAAVGPRLLLEVLSRVEHYLAEARTQDDALSSYAPKIDKKEAEIDWRQASTVLARRVRAFDPAPGCFSFLGDQRIKIWSAQPVADAPEAASEHAPGRILACDERGIVVACGEGALNIDRLQLPGARALPVDELLRARAQQFAVGGQFALPGNS